MWRYTRTDFRNARGAALAELALVLPLLLALLVGLMDFGKAIHDWLDQTHLANEAVRLAAVNYKPDGGWPTCPNADPTGGLGCYIQRQGDVTELVRGRTANSYSPKQNGAKVCISFPNVGHSTPLVGDPVQITVSIDYKWLNYLRSWLGSVTTTPITGTATMRLEATPSNYTSGCYTPPAPS
jgi:TadE-like protein